MSLSRAVINNNNTKNNIINERPPFLQLVQPAHPMEGEISLLTAFRALIAAALREGLTSWDLHEQNHISITTDNTSNMVIAARFNEWTRVQCLLSIKSHSFKLILHLILLKGVGLFVYYT